MRLDLVRAFAVTSSSYANGQEYGKLVGAWIFYERIARSCLRSDAQPVLPSASGGIWMMISLLVLRTMRETFTGVAPSSSLVK